MEYMNSMRDKLDAPIMGPLLSDLMNSDEAIRKKCLIEKDIESVETILQSGMVGYAYLYPHGAEIPQVYVFSTTPENVANLIGQHMTDCSEIMVTDLMDMPVLTTIGGFVDKCANQKLLCDVLQYLVPIQMGEAEAKEFPSVSMDTYDLYSEMLETAQMSMKMEM